MNQRDRDRVWRQTVQSTADDIADLFLGACVLESGFQTVAETLIEPGRPTYPGYSASQELLTAYHEAEGAWESERDVLSDSDWSTAFALDVAAAALDVLLRRKGTLEIECTN